MGKLVTPSVYHTGYTVLNMPEVERYLQDSDNVDFLFSIHEARKQGLSDGEILCSMYAKLCYASLTLGKNANITRVRDIPDNLRGCFNQGHGSVFEHCQLNFIVRNCSRVFTHELIRHRAGMCSDDNEGGTRAFEHEASFSQTSGRYVRGDSVDIVFDPILEPVREQVRLLQAHIEWEYGKMVNALGLDGMKDQTLKKKLTSALRRILPNGQSNEIGFSCNLRALRHVIQVRTSRYAEWEIRDVFNQVYQLTRTRYPLLYHGARERTVDGLLEVYGMRMQPCDAEHPYQAGDTLLEPVDPGSSLTNPGTV